MIQKTFKEILKELSHRLANKLGFDFFNSRYRGSTRYVKNKFGNKKLKVAEIGVYEGENAKNMLKHLNISKLYLIDPYEKHKEYPKIHKAEKIAKRRLKLFRNIIWVKNKSENVVDNLPNGFDFIYIDGDHKYSAVKKDLELYYPKIKRGGCLAGDDFQMDGVIKALIEFAAENNLQLRFLRTSDWVIQK